MTTETFVRLCTAVGVALFFFLCFAAIKPRRVVPVSRSITTELTVSLSDAVVWLERWLAEDCCDCGPEGHVCGRPALQRDVERFKAVLSTVIEPET